MPVRFAAPTRVPGRTQQPQPVAVPTTQGSHLGVGKLTGPMAFGQRPYGHLPQNAVPAADDVSAEFTESDYKRLLTDDDNGRVIVQFAREYALGIATQIVHHFEETPRDFRRHFDVNTDPIVIGDINGLPSASDEWKSQYGRCKIRIRILGSLVELAEPQAFLVTMSIEGFFGTDSGQKFKPILNELVGKVKHEPKAPSIAPPPEPDTPSVAPDSAGSAG